MKSLRTLAGGTALATLLFCGANPAHAQNYTYEKTVAAPLTNPLDLNSGFYGPNDLTVDLTGNLFVADTLHNRLVKIDQSGNLLGSISIGFPIAVTADGVGGVYLAAAGGAVNKYDSSGAPVWTVQGLPTQAQPSYAAAIALDSLGYLYQTDAANNKIYKYDRNGVYVTSFGTSGTKRGQFNAPQGIFVEPSGNILVADTGNQRVQKLDSAGNFLMKFGIPSTTTQNPGMGQFNAPLGIALDSFGNIVVSDITSNRFQVFNSQGKWVSQFGTFGFIQQGNLPDPNAVLFNPAGIAFDSTGRLFVADSFNNRIQVFYPAAADFSSSVKFSFSATTYRTRTGRYTQFVTVTNTSNTKIRRQLSLTLDNLTPGVSLYQATGVTSYVAPLKSPYHSKSDSLEVGESVLFKLEFVGPPNTSFSFTPRLLAGLGWR